MHVMDREGDAYDVMLEVVDAGDSALNRRARDRRIEGPPARAHAAVRGRPLLTREVITVHRQGGLPGRLAWVDVRSARVTPEPDLEKYPRAFPMTWDLVGVREPDPPEGAEAVHRLLLTREPAARGDEAWEVVRKYTSRWPIDEVHLVFKSGCHPEDPRSETWDRLEEAVTVEAAVAARVVSLRNAAREAPGEAATGWLSAEEAEALVCHFAQGKGPSELTISPPGVPWIGRLGGT
jgi:hypothetical protein